MQKKYLLLMIEVLHDCKYKNYQTLGIMVV